jgi:MraZ protein
MALFLSTFAKKIDKKGRVSVPAQFRAAMQDESFGGIVVYPSFVHSCVEACSMSRIKKLSDSIDNLDPFSEERDAFATAVLGGSSQLQFDSEGRVMLPLELLQQSGIEEDVIFVGKGQTFEIWEPKKFEAYSAKAREVALQKRGSLKLGGGNNA